MQIWHGGKITHTAHIFETRIYCIDLFSAPFQILVALYFLWQTLGPSVLAGFFVMILLVPLNMGIAGKTRKLQAKQMIEKDSRVKMMNELLQGIKVSQQKLIIYRHLK